VRRLAANGVFLAILLAGTVAATVTAVGYQAIQRSVVHRSGAAGVRAPATVALPPSAPVRLRISAIGVNAVVRPLGLLADGTLQPPSAWQAAGWYDGGVMPGDLGPAVIAGHVDSISGPAVFYRLRQLRPGDHAVVQRRDGRLLTFVVDSLAVYPKVAFPTAAVYGPTPLPTLRLVTCTGDFDWRAHSYLDNLVVSAHLRAGPGIRGGDS
jgi:sortase family protein